MVCRTSGEDAASTSPSFPSFEQVANAAKRWGGTGDRVMVLLGKCLSGTRS